MEADWEVEVGGAQGVPVIDALWPGFVDLRAHPERLGEIAEAAAFPPLAGLLRVLNGADSSIWTAKCDLWEPEAGNSEADCEDFPAPPADLPFSLACYIDLLPRQGQVFPQWQQAVEVCRIWVAQLSSVSLPDCRAELIVRQAIAGELDGFGVTAYLNAQGHSRTAAAEALAAALTAFERAIPTTSAPVTAASKLQ